MCKSRNESTYTLRAVPFLFVDGQFVGKMKNVTFVAESSTDTKRWFTINFGQFERAFARIVAPGDAKNLVASLIRGEDVEFPGFFQDAQFGSHFIYEHSGV